MRQLLWLIALSLVPIGYSWTQFFTKEREIGELDGMCLKEFANRIIYCEGPLIEAVNRHRLYNDSKEFVDKPLKKPPQVVDAEFRKRFPQWNISDIDPTELLAFVDEFFEPPTSELQECVPEDWKPNPPKIMQIQDPKLRQWALALHDIWKVLCRKINPDVKANPDLHSIIWVDEPFIAPGGRFREFYYSDTYWIVKGLIISNMIETAKMMTRNLASIVRRFGFIPNGGRIYYTNRSQPPMLAAMVYAIYEETGDIEYVKQLLPDLEREFDWWEHKRKFPVVSQAGNPQFVYFYKTGTSMPRPESMWADLQIADKLNGDEQKVFLESAASGAESGWDFSSRWFADRKTIKTMETSRIAPVDLNSYLCGNMEILGFLNREIGNATQATYYESLHQSFIWIHDEVFYNKSARGWYDFNNRTEKHIVHSYTSVATPLFTNCYSIRDENKPRRLFDNLQESGFFNFSGGVPASMIKDTNQQWDFPNGWAPLNHMLIEGLRQSSDPIMQDKAFEVAKKWIYGNYKVYSKTKHMYEKYDVVGDVPEPGGGGEYEVVVGFGWTNGAILDLLYTYYDRIEVPNENSATSNLISCTIVIPLLFIAFINSLI